MIDSDIKEKPSSALLPDKNGDKKLKRWPDVLTLEQVAEYLQVSLAGLWAYYKQMPGKTILGKWWIQKDKLDQWIESQTDTPKIGKLTGVVQRFFSDRGYGFIQAEDGRNVFVNTQYIKDPKQTLSDGDKVEFEIVQVPQGWAAKNVSLLEKMKGIVRFPSFGRHHNFIEAEDGRIVYVRLEDVKGKQPLAVGDTVEFWIARVPEGWEARNVIILASEPNPETERFYQEALVERDKGHISKAKELFEKSIASAPQPVIFISYADMEEKDGRPEDALKILQKGIQTFPSNGYLYRNYAMRLRKRKKLKQAEAILKEGLRKTPDRTKQFHIALATVLAELDTEESVQEAIAHFEQAEKLGGSFNFLSQRARNTIGFIISSTLGGETWRFLKKAGFEVWVYTLTNEYADLLILSEHVEYLESYDLQGRMLARCFFNPIQWQDINGLVQDIRKLPPKWHSGIQRNNDLAFLILDDAAPWEDALYRLLEKQREIIIPFDKSVFLRAKEEEPINVLRSVLDKWIFRRDLFNQNVPVSGRRFFGREAELQNLMRNIDDGEHTGIYGLRRVGKTSLMKQLREKRPQDFVVYIDLQEIPMKDCAYLYWKIARELQYIQDDSAKREILPQKVSLKLGSVSDYETLEQPEEKNAFRFDRDLNHLIDALSNHKTKTSSKVIIALDELELMLPGNSHSGFKGYADFFAHLRGIAQRTQGKLVSVVTAANAAISEQGIWDGRDNPVFQFYKEMFLPPLAQQECTEMIEKLGRGMSVFFDSESLHLIYQETGGHPFIARQFCSHLVKQNPARPLRVDAKLVTTSIDSFIRDHGAIFKEILDRLDYFPQEKILFERIVEGISKESELAHVGAESIDSVLRHLLGYQIVEYKDYQYQIKIRLLYRWLKRFRSK